MPLHSSKGFGSLFVYAINNGGYPCNKYASDSRANSAHTCVLTQLQLSKIHARSIGVFSVFFTIFWETLTRHKPMHVNISREIGFNFGMLHNNKSFC